MPQRKGSCLCGALKYEIEGNIDGVWVCHCSNCRKASGGTGNAIVIVKREQFRWIAGKDHRVTYELRPTYSITRCKTCGTPLPAEEDENNIYRLLSRIFGSSASPVAAPWCDRGRFRWLGGF
ncbi:MAG: hypothetical protein GY811_15080 [Myxococcales bacterium]|nr:hypothetical protein [Myxococcales bacterium]